MSANAKAPAIALLRLTVGVVIGIESALFAFSGSTARHLAHMGLPAWIGPTVGGIELIAALLFLVPAANRWGSYGLLAIFAVAIVLHFLHGEYNVGPLVIYAAAVWAVLGDRREPDGSVAA